MTMIRNAPPLFSRKHQMVTIICFIAIFTFTLTLWRVQHQILPELQRSNIPTVNAQTGPLIPRKIWQIYLPTTKSTGDFVVNPEHLVDTASWLALNQDYTYTLVGYNGANMFVDAHYSKNVEIISTYHALRNPGLKSDLLRYLLLFLEGGVYTDTDTYAHKSIEKWVPPELKSSVRLIVGIEFDRHGGGAWADISHYVQFCQWTIAAAPNHPVFPRMVDRVLSSLEELKHTYGTPLGELHPTDFEVMNATGPAAWTDVVFGLLQEADSSLKSLEDLSGMTEPRLFGDILVEPIDGFGMNQPHSHSTNNGTIPDGAFLEHHFRGSWRHE